MEWIVSLVTGDTKLPLELVWIMLHITPLGTKHESRLFPALSEELSMWNPWSLHSWYAVLCLHTRLSCGPNNNICKSHFGGKIVRDIKRSSNIFPTILLEISGRADDNRSAFCRGQWHRTFIHNWMAMSYHFL